MADTLDITEAEAGGGVGDGLLAAILASGAFKDAVVGAVEAALLAHPNVQNSAAIFTSSDSSAIEFLPGAGITSAGAADVASATSGAFLAGETLAALRTWPAMDEDGTDYSADFGVNPYVSGEVDGDFTLETCTIPGALVGGQVAMLLTCTSTTPNFANGDAAQHNIKGGLPTLEVDSYYLFVGDVIAGPEILWTVSGPFAV